MEKQCLISSFKNIKAYIFFHIDLQLLKRVVAFKTFVVT